jgi:Zn-dependent protease with chaperone function
MTVPFDGCAFDANTIVLAEGFRNELEPEDWGPLIASELIYMDRLQGKLWRDLLPRLAIPTILLLLAGILLWLFGILNLGGTVTSRSGGPVPLLGIIFPASILLVLPSYFILGLPMAKKLRLIADREAVEVTGTEQFIIALTKVGKLIPKLMVGKRPDPRYPFDRPSIKRRIEAIESTSSQLN